MILLRYIADKRLIYTYCVQLLYLRALNKGIYHETIIYTFTRYNI